MIFDELYNRKKLLALLIEHFHRLSKENNHKYQWYMELTGLDPIPIAPQIAAYCAAVGC